MPGMQSTSFFRETLQDGRMVGNCRDRTGHAFSLLKVRSGMDSRETECLRCGVSFPAESRRCPHCGFCLGCE
jgi:hypothetical protein